MDNITKQIFPHLLYPILIPCKSTDVECLFHDIDSFFMNSIGDSLKSLAINLVLLPFCVWILAIYIIMLGFKATWKNIKRSISKENLNNVENKTKSEIQSTSDSKENQKSNLTSNYLSSRPLSLCATTKTGDKSLPSKLFTIGQHETNLKEHKYVSPLNHDRRASKLGNLLKELPNNLNQYNIEDNGNLNDASGKTSDVGKAAEDIPNPTSSGNIPIMGIQAIQGLRKKGPPGSSKRVVSSYGVMVTQKAGIFKGESIGQRNLQVPTLHCKKIPIGLQHGTTVLKAVHKNNTKTQENTSPFSTTLQDENKCIDKNMVETFKAPVPKPRLSLLLKEGKSVSVEITKPTPHPRTQKSYENSYERNADGVFESSEKHLEKNSFENKRETINASNIGCNYFTNDDHYETGSFFIVNNISIPEFPKSFS